MEGCRRRSVESPGRLVLLAAALLLGLGATSGAPGPAAADDRLEARHLVERAKLTFDTFMANPDMGGFRDLLRRAKGVFISPQVLKGAFIFGVSGGSGVFLARDRKSGQWGGPAFYTIGEVSFGLQIGGEASQVVFVALTDRGVTALLSDSVKLGADVGVAVGPVGMGADASTANLSGDIIAFSISKGLYGGVSLEGAVVATRGDWNRAYYGMPQVAPVEILVQRKVRSQHAQELLNAVAAGAARR
jgi:lipid-binding SYLF domain-containing protein